MMAVPWCWRRHSFCHVRLGVYFMSWSNFCMLVWLSLSWRDFVALSDMIRMCGHVMDDVITLWWSRESWYDFSPSYLKFSSWCDFVCLDAIDWILVMIFLRLTWNFLLGVILFVLIRSTESWYDFSSFWLKFCLGVILFALVLFDILALLRFGWLFRLWCDFVWFGGILYLGAVNCILMWSLCFGWRYFSVH